MNNKIQVAIIFFITFIAYGYFSFGSDWNTDSRLALVKAFVDESRFEIDSFQELTGDKAYFNGHYYSDKAIGSSIFGVIVYYPIHWFYELRDVFLSFNAFSKLVTIFGISLPSALLAPFLYWLAKYVSNNETKAIFITFGISLGTPLFKYSTAFYGHALVAVFYFLAFFIWFYTRQKNYVSLKFAFIASFLLGFMVITEYPSVFLLVAISFYILFVLYETKQVFNWKIYLTMLIGFLLPVCILLYYNNSIFGSIFSTGYSFESNQEFQLAHSQSLMGFGLPNLYNFWYQTFQPAFGIFWQSPILFLALPGWFYMFKSKEYKMEALFSFFTVFAYITFFSGYYMWWGGISFSPRHLIPVFPLFVFPLALLPSRFIKILAISMYISIFQNLLLSASSLEGLSKYVENHLEPAWLRYDFFKPTGIFAYGFSLRNLIKGNFAHNRGMSLGLQGISSLFPLFLIELSFIIFLLKEKIYAVFKSMNK